VQATKPSDRLLGGDEPPGGEGRGSEVIGEASKGHNPTTKPSG
jgi:hypothetical protein